MAAFMFCVFYHNFLKSLCTNNIAVPGIYLPDQSHRIFFSQNTTLPFSKNAHLCHTLLTLLLLNQECLFLEISQNHLFCALWIVQACLARF